jgi:hypothetical protein
MERFAGNRVLGKLDEGTLNTDEKATIGPGEPSRAFSA